jgi:hypothetical protein
MKAPPLTQSAISGIVNDADLDPALTIRELGYRPLGVREGLPGHFSTHPKRDEDPVRGGAPAVRLVHRFEGTLQ